MMRCGIHHLSPYTWATHANCKKFCQNLEICRAAETGLFPNEVLPTLETNNTWNWPFPSFYLLYKAKGINRFVFWKVLSENRAKLCRTSGPTSFYETKKAPREFGSVALNLDLTAYMEFFRKKVFQCLCLLFWKIVFVLRIKYRLFRMAKKVVDNGRGFRLWWLKEGKQMSKLFLFHFSLLSIFLLLQLSLFGFYRTLRRTKKSCWQQGL